MNDSQQRERYNRWANQRNEDWYCSPPDDDYEELDGEPLAPYGRDSCGEPYTYEDMKSEHEDRMFHEARDEGRI
jgi:hypothetical protein